MRTFLLSCALLLVFTATAQARPIMADAITAPQPLMPYCLWLPDQEARHTIETVSSVSEQERFAPLRGGIPVRGGGPVWMRLTIAKSQPGQPGLPSSGTRSRLVINMGELPPGRHQIFYSKAPGPVEAEGIWHSEEVFSYEDILLPEPGLTPVTVYMRLAQVPGLWFAPQLSSESGAIPDMLPSELLLPGLLIALCAALLLRGLAEKSAWALWGAVLYACGLVQAVAPLPAFLQGLPFTGLPALLAPGLLLIILPHVGRCIFRRHGASAAQEAVLFACSLLGAAAALAPLLPGLGWLTRLFPLWGLLLAPLLPLCLGALAGKKPGALAFTGIVAMPLLGALLALYALKYPDLHPLAHQGALWGLAIGGIGLVLARIPKAVAGEEELEDEANAGLALAESFAGTGLAGGDAAKTFGSSGQYDELPPLEVSLLEEAAAKEAGPPVLQMDIQDLARSFPLRPAEEGDFVQGPEESAAFDNIFTPEEPAAVAESVSAGQEPFVPEAARPLPEDTPGLAAAFFDAGAAAEESALAAGEEEDAPAGPAPEDNASLEPETFSALEPEETVAKAATLPETGLEPEVFSAPAGEGAAGAEQNAAPEHPLAGAAEAAVADPEDDDDEIVELTADNIREEGGVISPLLPDFAGSSDSGALPDAGEARIISLTDEDFSSYPLTLMEELQVVPPRQSLPSEEGFVFNLHSLVREVHDTVAPFAKGKGLMLSWYIAPSLPSLLEGDAPRLRGALSLLLQNAVQATRQGSVQLAVRKNPNTNEAGDLLFSIRDSGSAQRTDAGFFHAWELAAKTGGLFNVDYSPGGGTQISFTARFGVPSEEAVAARLEEPAAHALDEADEADKAGASSMPEEPEDERLAAMTPEEVLADQGFLDPPPAAPEQAPAQSTADKAEERAPLDRPSPDRAAPIVVVAEMTTSNRRLLTHYLGELPYEHLNVASNKEVLDVRQVKPVDAIIFDGDMPEPDIVATIAAVREAEKAKGMPRASVLILTGHASQSRRMLDSGGDYALVKPFSQQELLEVVEKALGASLPGPAGLTARPATAPTTVSTAPVPVVGMDAPEAPGAPVAVPSGEMPAPEPARPGLGAFDPGNLYATPSIDPASPKREGVRMERVVPGQWDTLPVPGARKPVRQPVFTPVEEREVDILKAALRDAPKPTGAPVEVALPPRYSASEGAEPLGTLPGAPGEDETPEAAPVVMGLSRQDVVPAAEASPAVTKDEAGQETEQTSTPFPGAPESAPVREERPAASGDAWTAGSKPYGWEGEGACAAPASAASFGWDGEGASSPASPAPVPPVMAPPAAPEAPSAVIEQQEDGTQADPAPEAEKAIAASGEEAAEPATAAGTPRDEAQDSAVPERAVPPLEEALPPAAAADPNMYALPGIEGEALDSAVLPLIPGIIHSLSDALNDAIAGRESGRSFIVQEAAGRLAGKAEHFYLFKLGKIARCVERAAEADDMEAAGTLLDDLQTVTARYIAALKECFDSFLSIDR